MEQKLILYPMFALVVWTFAMGMVQFMRSLRAIREGMNPYYFRHNRGHNPPDYLLSASQHVENLFEMPMSRAKDRTDIIRTSSGVIDFAYYDQKARDLRATSATAAISKVLAWLRCVVSAGKIGCRKRK